LIPDRERSNQRVTSQMAHQFDGWDGFPLIGIEEKSGQILEIHKTRVPLAAEGVTSCNRCWSIALTNSSQLWNCKRSLVKERLCFQLFNGRLSGYNALFGEWQRRTQWIVRYRHHYKIIIKQINSFSIVYSKFQPIFVGSLEQADAIFVRCQCIIVYLAFRDVCVFFWNAFSSEQPISLPAQN
jgi:hypothetical protein